MQKEPTLIDPETGKFYTKQKRGRLTCKAKRAAVEQLVYCLHLNEARFGILPCWYNGQIYSIIIRADGGAMARKEMRAIRKEQKQKTIQQ